MTSREEPASALARATAYLERVQLADGRFGVRTTTRARPHDPGEDDASVFPTALAVHCLTFWRPAAGICRRALSFLQDQQDGYGLWRHWTRDHPLARHLPPDLDDTSCASAALSAAGHAELGNRDLILANRNADGLFFTWFTPRPRWAGVRHLRATLRQLAHAPQLWLFYRRTSAKPGDVDAVVNANALHCLGCFPGDDAVVAFLTNVLETDRERQCDKWYENPFAIWYFFARALAGRSEHAASLLAAKLRDARPGNALEAALSISAAHVLGLTHPRERLDQLITLQRADGSWPRAMLYHGGRARRSDGGFDEPHPDTPHWGSDELTTAFCVEALARWLHEAGS